MVMTMSEEDESAVAAVKGYSTDEFSDAVEELGLSETGKLRKTNKAPSGGTFAAMGLMPALLKAIQRKGFRQPTPIQRKAIPILLQGRDVVGMARTGSGKTAAFLLPLLQHLRAHSARVGIRALILSPSRELALQTLGVAQALAKFTDLRIASLIGGDGLEEQFARMATNPDLVVATPGRLLHVCMEAGLSLKTVQSIVWDEADRLMEDPTMAGQMAEITAMLGGGGGSRQTALFSATLPKALVEFAQAGLTSPALIRLDADSKVSPDLVMRFLAVKTDYRDAALLWLLDEIYGGSNGVSNVISNGVSNASKKSSNPQSPLTVIFTATKHHVEYLQELLGAFGRPCVYIYGSLDQAARLGAIEAFREGRRPILVVTDVAARGIDVPLLDNVINYDFPPTPKLFLHRVGRVARAGRSGMAFSLVCPDELPYLLDVGMFLGQGLEFGGSLEGSSNMAFGSLLQAWLDDEQERLVAKLAINGTVSSLKQVMLNATKLYRRTRPPASPESHRRAKELQHVVEIPLHPAYSGRISQEILQQGHLVAALRSFKPKQAHIVTSAVKTAKKHQQPTLSSRGDDDSAKSFRDSEHYLGYRPAKDSAFEDKSYAIGGGSTNFAREAASVMFDLGGNAGGGGKHNLTNEDPSVRAKRAKSNNNNNNRNTAPTKMIKTDRGTRIPASYQTDLYARWRNKTKMAIPKAGDLESAETVTRANQTIQAMGERGKWRKGGKKGGGKKAAAAVVSRKKKKKQ